MKKSVIINKMLAVILSGTAVLSSMSVAVGAVNVQPPMHDQYGRPVTGYVVQQAAGIPFAPTSYIGNYRRISAGAVNQNISQATYDYNGRRLILRKARGSTGMHSTYPITYRTYSYGCNILLTGNRNGYFTAEWSKNGYCYSMSSNVPLTEVEILRYFTAATNA
ncbi:MAG: hypothetical protein ILP19_00660 [Oscillospiraceae bacterium]|nr:hypothetical protein [Oscillospiraceae bacterium]